MKVNFVIDDFFIVLHYHKASSLILVLLYFHVNVILKFITRDMAFHLKISINGINKLHGTVHRK